MVRPLRLDIQRVSWYHPIFGIQPSTLPNARTLGSGGVGSEGEVRVVPPLCRLVL